MNDLLIVGRGESISEFGDWDSYQDILAVSSAIFIVPESARGRVQFAAQDDAKFYLEGLHRAETLHAWQHDPRCKHWHFWKDGSVPKHVPADRNQHGGYRQIPDGVWEAMPQRYHAQFAKSITFNQHQWGLQPNWGDFPGCVGHEVKYIDLPNFSDTGPIGLSIDGPKGRIPMRNSFFFTVQVAHRLGFRRLFFAGVDFLDNRFKLSADRARVTYERAKPHGHEWFNLSSNSELGFLPSPARV